MKLKFYSILIATFLSFHFAQAQYGESGSTLFDNSYIHEIQVEFSDINFWQKLGEEYEWNQGNPTLDKKYQQASIWIDGTRIDSIGFRQKGFFSNWGSWESLKKPFKVDLNEFVSGTKYEKLKKFNLNNSFLDPTYERDAMAYDMMRRSGVRTPRTSHAKVWLNGEYWGVYAIVEQVDQVFLEENFSDGTGTLYKCTNNTQLGWQGVQVIDYEDEFELRTNRTANDWSRFIDFVRILNKEGLSDQAYLDSMATIFDVDQYLKALAVDIAIVNWDSYYEHGRNFYLYHNPKEDRFYWIPWDYNLSFSNEVGVDIFLSMKPLIKNIFNFNQFKDLYNDHICYLKDHNMTLERMDPFIEQQRANLAEPIMLSDNEFFSFENHDLSFDMTVMDSNFGDLPGLRPVITSRNEGLTLDLLRENHTCLQYPFHNFQDITINELMASNDMESAIADPDGEYEDWIELYNNTPNDINLKNYGLSDSHKFPFRFLLPDVTIPANGYLIVWADFDRFQEGLHADFLLRKNGEQVILTAADNTVLDSVSYDEQVTNFSYMRIPNGTGDFIETDKPTFNRQNEKSVGISEEDKMTNVTLFPNPTADAIWIRSEVHIDRLQVTNAHGQKVMDITHPLFPINLKDIPAGIINIQLTAKDQTSNHKLTVM